MKDETAFLSAIRADHGNRTFRLVYADWLEEQADPRAELIRIEEEMRLLPVFSERYWQLKPRRHQLRAVAESGWLAEMRYGTDSQPVFRHGVPDGWKERWRLIRAYVEQWHRLQLPDIGGQADKIRATEARLGRTLPPSVREWVAFAHDVGGSGTPFVFRDSYQMHQLADHAAISLLLQAEGDHHWAVRNEDLALPDPPVHGFVIDFEQLDEIHFMPSASNPEAKSVTDFVLGYALGYTPSDGFHLDVGRSQELVQQLKDAFPVYCNLGHMELFEAENVLIRLHHWTSREYLWVKVFKPLSEDAIPEFLWHMARSAGAWEGDYFLPEQYRQQHGEQVLPEQGLWQEDIPF